jgi:hypothetical protein
LFRGVDIYKKRGFLARHILLLQSSFVVASSISSVKAKKEKTGIEKGRRGKRRGEKEMRARGNREVGMGEGKEKRKERGRMGST